MGERTCESCGAVVPADETVCPSCHRLVAKASTPKPVSTMSAEVLPPGMTDAPPEARYGHAGEADYVPPTSFDHRPARGRRAVASWDRILLWTIAGVVVAAVVIAVFALLG